MVHSGTPLVPDGMPGGALSLSANGEQDGIVWGVFPLDDATWGIVATSPTRAPAARMIAFDAMTLAPIWEDPTRYPFAKFVPPTIANGRVYRSVLSNDPNGNGQLIAYSLLSGLRRFASPAAVAPVLPELAPADPVQMETGRHR